MGSPVLLWCFGVSLVDYLREDDEQRIVVVFYVVVIGAAVATVVEGIRVRCLCVCCWLGFRSRGGGSVGRVVCLSLLLMKSLSMVLHSEPCCAVVSQVFSLGKSWLLLLVLVGCTYALRSSSHLFAGPPSFRCPFCLIDTTRFSLAIDFVERSSWCWAINLACFQYILLCLGIHNVVPFTANKSSTLCVARTT